MLEGVQYEDQHNRWNYCGPANLSMSLTFWGWQGNRDIVAEQTKGNEQDKNIFPSEMVEFVQNHTSYSALDRVGGNLDLLMRLIAAGFPVLTEKGYYEFDYTGNYAWMGHYQFVTGYDQTERTLIVQDTYIQEGENHEFGFDEFVEGWRSFNFVFVVVYPPEREAEVLELLGPYADEQWAIAHALDLAESETESLTDVDEYFAWFNIGTNHVLLFEYIDAAHAFDKAFQLYAELPGTIRPYRMLWYQTGPYKAYYYSGRYQEVYELANYTLFETITDPILEESFYWRGLAKEQLGDLAGAIFDWQVCLELHPGWGDAIYELQRVGAWP
jgi:tetratricopeptide (TPR) repeat protein